MPNIYFMNPKGFKAREDLSPQEVEAIIMDCEWKGDVTENPKQVRPRKDIYEEFQQTYKQLLTDKEKPVLVFDTCLHTGNTLSPVKQMLEQQGFADIRIGSVNPTEVHAKVQSDFSITDQRPLKGCYPFDQDRLIEKTFDHVYSKGTDHVGKKATARELREEIKRIVKEHMGADQES